MAYLEFFPSFFIALQAMLDVVGEMRHLCGLDEAPAKSPTPNRKGVRSYSSRSVSPVGKRESRDHCATFHTHREVLRTRRRFLITVVAVL